jgi:hypothetical protein
VTAEFWCGKEGGPAKSSAEVVKHEKGPDRENAQLLKSSAITEVTSNVYVMDQDKERREPS